jgi:hypothetical protein
MHKSRLLKALFIAAILSISTTTFLQTPKTSTPDKQKAQEAQQVNTLLPLLQDPEFKKAEQKPLDSDKLLNASDAQGNIIDKPSGELKTHLYIEFDKTGFTGILESMGTTTLKGFVKYQFNNKGVEINFGPDYGFAKLTLNPMAELELSRLYEAIKNFYAIKEDQTASFEYTTTYKMDPKTNKPVEPGTLKIKVGDKTSSKEYNPEDDNDRNPSRCFWRLMVAAAIQAKSDSKEVKDAQKADAYEKSLAEAKKFEGVFTLYQRKNEILLELTEADLGRLVAFQSAIHSSAASMMARPGSPATGEFRFDVDIFKWERREDYIALVRPQTKNRWDKGSSLEFASEMSYPDAIIGSFRIEQEHPSKKLMLINVTELFLGTTMNLNELVRKNAGFAFMLDRNTSIPESIKSFPENTVVRMNLHFMGADSGELSFLSNQLFGGSRLERPNSLAMKITYNMWYHKPSDYQPRLADPRIGYFTQDHTKLEKTLKFDHTIKFINRFNLKKKNPEEALSEPVKPIVWHIDRSVPKEYRQAIRNGILRWNKAFEAIGFKDAQIVKDAPEKDADWDHADGRYNVVRWVIDEAICMGILRCDPFTGEILSAGVDIDASYLRAVAVLSYPELIKPTSLSSQGKIYTKENLNNVYQQIKMGQPCCSNKGHHHSSCSAALTQQMPIAWDMISAVGVKPIIAKKDFLDEWIAEVVSHEVGHCLGLRHNFKGSNFASTIQLGDTDFVRKHGSTASVMDYLPINIQMIENGHGPYFPHCIGVYDKWAIRYGYSEFTGKTTETEKDDLEKIARESGKPGHAYATDEDTMSPDPYVRLRDHASDPINYSSKVINVFKKYQDYFVKNFFKEGKSHEKNTWRLMNAMNHVFNETVGVTAFIGGMETSRTFVGDIGHKPSLKPIDPELQRQAMRLITKEALSMDAIKLPENVLNNLSYGFNNLYNPTWNAPLRTLLHEQQAIQLFFLMHPGILTNIAENQFKIPSGKPAYTLQEHFATIFDTIYPELKSEKAPTQVRQDLQRFALKLMIEHAGDNSLFASSGQADAKLIASSKIQELKELIEMRLKNPKNLNEMNILHLKDMKHEIDQFHKRQQMRVILSF